MILIHGWSGSSADWQPAVAPLNAAGWRTLALDCPGHGDSDPPGDRRAYTMAALADLHRHVVRSLGLAPAVVVGISMGGAIAEEYAIRHPDDLTGLVLVGSAGGDWVDEEAEAEIAEAEPIAFSEGMEALWEVRQQRLNPEEFTKLPPDVRDERRRKFARTSPEGYVYTLYGLLEKRNTVADLARLRKPTLIIHGERETDSIAKAARRAHAAIPGSRYIVVAEAGHSALSDNPAGFNRALIGFLADVRRTVE